jgi:hypothetical protein
MSTEPVVTDGIVPALEQVEVEAAPLTLGTGFRPAGRWASFAVVLLALEAATLVISAVFAVMSAAARWRFDGGVLSATDLNSFLQIVGALVSAAGILELVCAVPFLVWLYRSMRNAPEVGAATTAYSPLKAVVVWFVPLANFVLPYRIVRDLHGRLAAPDGSRVGLALVRTWWAAWLGGAIILAGARLTQDPGPALVMVALSLSTYFGAAILAIAVVRHIQRLADAREARLAGRLDDAAQLDLRARRRRVALVPVAFGSAGAILVIVLLATVALPAGPNWAIFNSPSGGFAVSLPRVPLDAPATVQTFAGAAVQHTFASPLDAKETYAVSYLDFPVGSIASAGRDTMLNEVVTASIGTDEKLGAWTIALGTVPGREVKLRLAKGTIVNVRYYLDGDRIYGLEVATTAERATSSNIARFFGSFTLRP